MQTGACASVALLLRYLFVMPPKTIPPGLLLVLPYVPLLFVPLLVVYFCSLFVALSFWTFFSLVVFSLPTCLAAQINLKTFIDRRTASSLGAVLPPIWNGTWFGNVDILLHLLEASERGYLGTSCVLSAWPSWLNVL